MPAHLLPRIAQAEAAAHAAQSPGGWERFGPLVAVWTEDAAPLDTAWHDGTCVPTETEWDAFEAFCARHGQTPTVHALSHAAPELLPALNARGFQLTYVLHVYAHDLKDLPLTPPNMHQTDNALDWAGLAAQGFGPSTAEIMRAVALAPGKRLWWAKVGGQPVATGAYSVVSGVAALHGTATRPEFRGRGLQTALLAARLNAAQQERADLATVMVTPGTGSERNVMRAGFRLAGMRLTWTAAH